MQGGGEEDGGHYVVGLEKGRDEGGDEGRVGCECREACAKCLEPLIEGAAEVRVCVCEASRDGEGGR